MEWNFSNLEIFHISFFNKNQLNRIFIILPVSSSVRNEKIFIKKYGVTGLVFKIDAIDGKKWVKFVAYYATGQCNLKHNERHSEELL